jgi:hypothetical protein
VPLRFSDGFISGGKNAGPEVCADLMDVTRIAKLTRQVNRQNPRADGEMSETAIESLQRSL